MDKVKGIFYVIGAAIIFGFIPFFAKKAFLNGFNEMTFILGRCIFATLFLYIYIKKKGIIFKASKRDQINIFKISIIGYGMMLYILVLSYSYMPTGIATSIHFIYPLVVMIGGVIFYGERISFLKILTLVTAFTGIYFIVGYKSQGNLTLLGFTLAFISGVLYAYYILVVGSGNLKKINSIELVFYVSFLNVFFFFISSLITGNLNLNITGTGYLYIIILAILSLMGMIGFKKGLELINTVTAAILSTFEPVTSLIVGVLLLEEMLLIHHIIGSLLIICAVVFVALIEKKEKTMVKSEVEGKVK